MDEEYWRAYRKRARERVSRQFFVILGPILVLVAIWSLVAPTSLSPGDYRNDPVFRVLMAAAFIAGGVGAFIASARWLIADRRK